MNRTRWLSFVKSFPLLLLLVPALQPLLTTNFTCGYDNVFHLWRAVEVEHLVWQGVLFSRWAPDMVGGYGYPLFNFTAPASAYGVVVLRLLGLSWPWALNLTFVVGWILSAFAMYLLANDLFDHYAGVVAAVLYSYAPFHAYDVFYRGGLSESSAWLFPPLILWALCRVERRVGFAVGALGTAGLVLTHNAFALLFVPFLLIYPFVVGYQRGRKAALWGSIALLVGLGLSAFFWLPALTDLGVVQSERARGDWVFEYASNFLPLELLFAPPRTADPTLINDWPARGLGLIPALLAMAGLPTLRDHQRRPQVAFFAGTLTICLFLILPISRPVWDMLPLLQHVQFPWRLVGPATLCAAVLAGAATFHLSSSGSRLLPLTRRSPSLIPAVLILLLILTHLGWFYPRHCSPPEDITVAGMIDWERQSRTVGTTALGEFLPTWVESVPQDTYLQDQIAAGGEVARLDETTLPENAVILEADYHSPNYARILIDSPTSFQARYLAFYFPGWRVSVDGKPIEVTPTIPGGLIAFEMPAGRHTVTIHFAEPLHRLVADLISGLSGVILVCTLLTRSRHL